MDLVDACERAGLHSIAERAKQGEFDAGRDESDEWMRSRDGQDTMKRLLDETAGDKP